MTDYENDITEDLKEIKNTLKKMQADIKRIEDNISFYTNT